MKLRCRRCQKVIKDKPVSHLRRNFCCKKHALEYESYINHVLGYTLHPTEDNVGRFNE